MNSDRRSLEQEDGYTHCGQSVGRSKAFFVALITIICLLMLQQINSTASQCCRADKSPPPHGGSNYHQAVVMFCREVAVAISQHDCAWLSQHIDFPLRIRLASGQIATIDSLSSLKVRFRDIFPSDSVQALAHVSDAGVKQSEEGLVLGDTGIICLAVPLPSKRNAVTYLIYRVKNSVTLPTAEVSSKYPISWADRFFFVQLKDALRAHLCGWLSEHTAKPFLITDALGIKRAQVGARWLRENCQRVWYQPRKDLVSKDQWSTYTPADLQESLSASLAGFPTLDLWANWQGIMAANGSVWFYASPGKAGTHADYRIIAINPIGSAQESTTADTR